jgi:hypothetical protein
VKFPRATHLVGAFEKEEDARRFYEALGERMAKFDLELSAEKTQIIPFSANRALGSSSFNFLGFEFCWGKDRASRTWTSALPGKACGIHWHGSNYGAKRTGIAVYPICSKRSMRNYGDTSITLVCMETCQVLESSIITSSGICRGISTNAASARAIIGKGSSSFWTFSAW